jgi:hypothetical protein
VPPGYGRGASLGELRLVSCTHTRHCFPSCSGLNEHGVSVVQRALSQRFAASIAEALSVIRGPSAPKAVAADIASAPKKHGVRMTPGGVLR